MRKVKSSSVAIQAFPVDDKSPRMKNAVGFGKAKRFDIGLSNCSMPPYPFPVYPNMYPEKEKTTRFDLGLSSASAASSTVGSPLSNHGEFLPVIEWASNDVGMGSRDHFSSGYNFAGDSKPVDPAMIYHSNLDMIYPDNTDIMYPGNRGPCLEDSWSFGQLLAHPSHGNEETLVHKHSTCPASPALSVSSYQHVSHYGPLQNHNDMSFGSTPTQTGRISSTSPFTPNYPFTPAFSSDNTETKKERCPHPDCGKTFKDLKAHMLTHQTERPEKCPIMSCEYHIKGFARKHDKNRHTLTHYKGTMVCGFCPGSGSPAEKSFNRADVFKRHLTTVHRADRKPPNSQHQTMSLVAAICNTSPRSSPPSTNGDCSTCSRTFSNPQMFYEHLDNCLLHVLEDMDSADVMNRRPSTEVNACFSLPRSISINIMRSTRENLDIIPVKGRRLMSSAESTSSRMGKLPNVTELHTATEAMSSLLRIPSDRVGCFLDTSRIFMKKSSYFVERMLTDPTTDFKITKASRGFWQRLSLLVQSQIWGLVPWTSHRGWNISF